MLNDKQVMKMCEKLTMAELGYSHDNLIELTKELSLAAHKTNSVNF